MKNYKISHLGTESNDKVFQALKEVDNPTEIGTILTCYVTDTFDKEERLNVIKNILTRFTTDFLIDELPKGEVERLRKLIDRI
ncbi:MAG: hypothetical protein E6860_04785 [Clostridium sp.]|uniref:hypothetical protein n=1 Tax=Clostridium TaxID=1485 RepID=UPI0006BF8A22|nr:MULTISPECIES: hypothetical protein [Clostridium]MDU1584847.1 hypothetical protein [Clostridium sp.]CUO14581.1 Uncharacterised protein [Clostridium paraputrificum]